MWRAAFCSIWCCIGIMWLRSIDLVEKINPTNFPQLELTLELFSFIVLGTLCGLLGALLINVSTRLISLKEQNVYPMLYGRYKYTSLIITICAVSTYITQYTRLSDKTVINDMFQGSFQNDVWSPNLGLSLTVFFISKFLLTSISLSAYIPAGVLYPTLVAGAVFGTLFEYSLRILFISGHSGIYAAVGAAALVSGTTHTISATVIIFELTGEIHYFLPMIVAVLMAYTISKSLTLSIYDSMVEIQGLPYLPSLKPYKLHSYIARDIMEYTYPQLNLKSTLEDLLDAIQEAGNEFNKIPVIDPNNKLLYDIQLAYAIKYFLQVFNDKSSSLSNETINEIKKYTDYLFNITKRVNDNNFLENFLDFCDGNQEIKNFLRIEINFESEVLCLDDSPFAITESSPLPKIHFLFIMLGLSQVYVIRKGILVGMISRESFTKKRYLK